MESGLNKKDLEKISTSSDIVFRKKCFESLTLLNSNKVPFIVLSASGAGDESVISCLKSCEMYLNNVDVISNKYLWNSAGYAIERVKPYIHTFNKSGISIIESKDIYSKIKGRKNVILIGDSLGDCNMAEGLDYDNALKIRFLNSDVKNKLESYKLQYDVVITDDCEFDFIFALLQ